MSLTYSCLGGLWLLRGLDFRNLFEYRWQLDYVSITSATEKLTVAWWRLDNVSSREVDRARWRLDNVSNTEVDGARWRLDNVSNSEVYADRWCRDNVNSREHVTQKVQSLQMQAQLFGEIFHYDAWEITKKILFRNTMAEIVHHTQRTSKTHKHQERKSLDITTTDRMLPSKHKGN